MRHKAKHKMTKIRQKTAKQKLAKARRESEIQRTMTTTTMTTTTIKTLFMGQDCTGWVGRVELPPPPHPPTPSTQHPPPHPTHGPPRFSGSPPLSIPQFHCRSLFMYSRVRTLGLVSSFGSVLLIFC
uniref:Uncharacterized protein n=1 Tax=Amphiprion ocellaris TaxID=80972 RepID=A0AAQ5ZCW5_AMPOC